MMEISHQLALVSAMLTLLCIKPSLIVGKEHEDFSYSSYAWNGPQHWGDILKDWETCKIGRMQSPVAVNDLASIAVQKPNDLMWSYYPKEAVMKNLGHNIVIEWIDEVGGVSINGASFPLKEVHWHMPSEHTINGDRFELELHLRHQRLYDKKMAMVSILYTVGEPDPFFAKIENHIRTISRKLDATVNLGIVDPNEIKRIIDVYYRLNGSITIPPCTEGVAWTINKKIRTISLEQLNLLKYAAIPEYSRNARPLQRLNDRVVKQYGCGVVD